jgi:hypothetical protein
MPQTFLPVRVSSAASFLEEAAAAAAPRALDVVHFKGFGAHVTSAAPRALLESLGRADVVVFDGDDRSTEDARSFTSLLPLLLASRAPPRLLAFKFASEEGAFLRSWAGDGDAAGAAAAGRDAESAGPDPSSAAILHYCLVDDSVGADAALRSPAAAAALSDASRASLGLGLAPAGAARAPPPYTPSGPVAAALGEASARYVALGVFAAIATGAAPPPSSPAAPPRQAPRPLRRVVSWGGASVVAFELACQLALGLGLPWEIFQARRVKGGQQQLGVLPAEVAALAPAPAGVAVVSADADAV